MLKPVNFALFAILFLSSVLGGYAQDRLFLVTPAQTISTCKKNSLQEGDYVKFRVVDGKCVIPNDKIIEGVVRELEENGFCGKQAQAIIQDFKCENYKIACIKRQMNLQMDYLPISQYCFVAVKSTLNQTKKNLYYM